jgi:hypothetical protein
MNWSGVDDWVSHCVVDGSNMVLDNGLVVSSTVVGDTVGGVVHCGNMGGVVSHWGNNCVVCHGGHTVWGGSLVMDERGDRCLVDWSLMVGGLGTVDRGGDWGVAVGSSVVDLGIGVSLCLCFCVGAGCHKGQNNQV